MPTSANSSAAYVHMYSLIAAESFCNYISVLKVCWLTKERAGWLCLPRTLAKTDAKKPNVNENGPAM